MFLRVTSAVGLSTLAAILLITVPALAQAPGGFLESAPSLDVRPLLTQAELEALLPPRGLFTFPAPYLTQGLRLTNATDCGGADCVDYVGYSYWRNTNNHVGSDTMLIFVGLNRTRGGAGPTLFSYTKSTDAVQNLGPLFDASSPFGWETGEGWYFSHSQPSALYVTQSTGSQLLRYDVSTKQFQTVFDVAPQFGSDKYIWQTHSSDDDLVHSATLRATGTWEMLGCVVYHEDTTQFSYFPKTGSYDECQIDKSGRYLLIKENTTGINEDDNVIVDLQTGAQQILTDQQGAAGHSDAGYGYMVAADNWYPLPNTLRLWSLAQDPITSSGSVVYYGTEWTTATPGHVSHANAQSTLPPEAQFACGSSANAVNAPLSNEVFCFMLDGSLRVLVVAPVMTDLNASGGGSDSYAKLPKGNLDVTGQYFVWTSNMASSRLDAFIVKVPAQLLTSAGPLDTLPPSVSLTTPTSGATTSGTVTVAASASDDTGVIGVQFKLDGANLGAEVTAAPYSVSWNTTTALDGIHTLTALARDAAGNIAESAPVSVGVLNLDPIPPSVSLTAPTPGATVKRTVTVAASASDNVGVVGVQFKLDGASLGAEVTAAPYSISWNSAAVANGAHTITAVARDAAGNTAVSAPVSVTVSNGPGGQKTTWTNLVNVTATGNSLTKTSGCDGCFDAGATSQQQITSGNGYVEFTATETATLRVAGLTHTYSGTDPISINFAIRLQAGIAEVREGGVYRTDLAFTTGDVFRIALQSGVVRYYKNGVLFYTSAGSSTYPLFFAAALADLNATVSNVVIAKGP
ncbi:MAG: Ig-like domain-containing protein [Candidatus Rokubacteria bacterium]|nr:Ig-like domain-containing protein [Candidatus Rokubacteria bacterium]